jgi:pyruvate ferredoxin oxidoreductase gamma subunit
MFSVRFHGSGGQGVVTSAELLASAVRVDGGYAEAYTSGSGRNGAPMVSFCRISQEPIEADQPVTHPDAVLVQDPMLARHAALFAGLGPEGYILINSAQSITDLRLAAVARRFRPERLLVLPATELARESLGWPVPCAAMLGGFAALTGVVGIGSVLAAITDRFAGTVADGIVAEAQAAYAYVLDRREAA